MATPLTIAALAVSLSATNASAPANAPALTELEITREQARERADELFDRFDLNHNGVVTRAEAQRVGVRLMLVRAKTGVDQTPGLGGHTLRFLKHRFAGAEAVAKLEFEAAFLAHFDEMDANHDGILTAAERLQAR